jgi:7-cyano-7-deazaguanine synthase
MAKPTKSTGRAVILLSGGLDSATCLAIALAKGRECHAVSFDYGQRHRGELSRARRLAKAMGAASHRVVKLELASFGGSALTDRAIAVPKGRSLARMATEIPVTYVPARNLVMLSVATALAETLGAEEIFIGANAIDYSGYPDCRPPFLRAFERVAHAGTKAGVEGRALRIRAPLLSLSKAAIVRLGTRLGVPYGLTQSCYDPVGGRACGRCDSCILRRRGFEEAGVPDPTPYVRRPAPAGARGRRVKSSGA